MQNTESRISPAEELAAWNDWKKICFVDGCSPKSRIYLRRRIIARISQELKKYCLSGAWENRLEKDEMISEFDLFLAYKDGLPCVNDEQAAPRHKFKQHKDYVWHKMRHSDDPPMQVLNGYLLGPRGIIMDVIRKLLKTQYPMWNVTTVDKNSGKKINRMDTAKSLQDPLYREKILYTLEESLADNQPTPDVMMMEKESKEKLGEALTGLTETLSKNEKLLLLAHLLRISISAPPLTQALGKGKSTAYTLLQKTLDKIKSWHRDNDDVTNLVRPEAHQILCRLLLAQLQKAATAEMREFLSLALESLPPNP